jgi:hypothetical protein
MSRARTRILGVVALAGALTLSASPAFAAGGGSYTCWGGDIPTGTYNNIVVAGWCSVPTDAEITVTGNITVNPGAVLDAQSSPATVTVGRNVTAGAGSMLGLGCQPPALTHNSAHPCSTDAAGHTTITVGGNVTATDAYLVMLNGIDVAGNVTESGGVSDLPWSIKNNQIQGNVTVSGLQPEWLGLLFNHIGGNVTLTDIALSDPDPGAPGVYVAFNTIGRNLTCSGLTVLGVPGVAVYGNTIGKNAVGQCAA